MTTYNTGNALGSAAAKDLYDNAQNLDVFVNDSISRAAPDRLGVQRKTWHGIESDHSEQMAAFGLEFETFLVQSGYQYAGDYESGPLTLTSRSQLIRYDGEYWHVAASAGLPFTTTGADSASWSVDVASLVSVGDAALRSDLIKPTGAGMIGSMAGTVQTDIDGLENSVSTINSSISTINNHADLVIDDYLLAGETTYDNAIQRVLTASLASGRPIKFLPRIYNFASPVTLNMDATGIKIYGAGVGRTELRFPNAATGVTQLIIKSSADWFDLVWEGMSVRSSHTGTLCQIGNTSYVDPLNVARLQDLAFLNSGTGGNNVVALRLAYGVQCSLINVRANCYADGAGTNVGRALVVEQAGFTSYIACSFGNASYGVSFLNGVSFANNFIGCDFENINIALYNGSVNSGGHTFIGCQFSLWTQYLAQAPVGATNRFLIINPNVSQTSGLLDPANGVGIKFQSDQLGITTPAVPASGVTVTNTTGRDVVVTVWAGNVSAISRNGAAQGMAGGTVILHPMDTIALTYSVAPGWTWYKLG
ncbi:hypothetical protein [Dickeya chrysanthemi]|uniref:hypothetical protein n=1 Tax=Dickeya chrysanthemi TaxID=556 RepID=UPI001CF307DE|nr:hypothetical protein [Dickeya chrysanthemi]MCA7008257.1 hypothetical protein [Dickeya chrysanthemi]